LYISCFSSFKTYLLSFRRKNTDQIAGKIFYQTPNSFSSNKLKLLSPCAIFIHPAGLLKNNGSNPDFTGKSEQKKKRQLRQYRGILFKPNPQRKKIRFFVFPLLGRG